MKLVAVCGQGLGSSLIVEMNLKEVLSNLNHLEIEVEHTNLNSFDPTDNSIMAVVCGQDLADSISFDHKIVLENLFDKTEMEEKLVKFLNAEV